MVKQLETLAEFEELVLKAEAGKLVVVDFWATWCGPCVRIAPIYIKLAEAHTEVLFFKVDVDSNSDTSENQDISCMPTFKFYKNGKVVDTLEGASQPQLEAKIASHK